MKIAYIEDENFLREDTKKFLTANNFEVTDFCDSIQLFNYIKDMETLPFDLFIIDIILPGMSGIDIVKELTQKDLLVNIPVIFMSAINEEEKIIDAYLHSKSTLVVDYIIKPVSTNMFIIKINNLIRLKKYQNSLMAAKNEILKYNLELKELLDDKEAVNDYLKERLVKIINSQDKVLMKKIETVKEMLPNLVTTDLSLLKFVLQIIVNSKSMIEKSVMEEFSDEEEFFKLIPKTIEPLKTAIVDIELVMRSFITLGILDENRIKKINIHKTSFFEILNNMYQNGYISKNQLDSFVENSKFEKYNNDIELF